MDKTSENAYGLALGAVLLAFMILALSSGQAEKIRELREDVRELQKERRP